MVKVGDLHSMPLSRGRVEGGTVHLVVNGIFTSSLGLRDAARELGRKFKLDPRRVRTYFVEDGERIFSSADDSPLGGFSRWLATDYSPRSDQLAAEVRTLLQNHAKVVLHGHSRGALVIDRALDQLPDVARRLGAVTYGGVRFVDPSKAARVYNVVNVSDSVASMGRLSIWHAERSQSAAATVLMDLALQRGEQVASVALRNWSTDVMNNHGFLGYLQKL